MEDDENVRRERLAGSAYLALLLSVPLGLIDGLLGVLFIMVPNVLTFVLFTVMTVLLFPLLLFTIVQGGRSRGHGGYLAVLGVLNGVVVSVWWLLGSAFGTLVALFDGVTLGGGAWGRPLRVLGRQLHPELRLGTDWTRGQQPDASGLTQATRDALEALWLHDAQKEHASVPAFSRVSWMLAAVGAPPELLRWAHRAAVEEIDHAERCFALAAGYGGRAYTVEPMPDLLMGGTPVGAQGVSDPIGTLVYESITDGCQLEEFNADVAARCAAVCRAPVTRGLLEQIAREERDHAAFSWAVVEWALAHAPEAARAAASRALVDLARYPRPTAYSADKRALVEGADPDELRAHGRLPDEAWAEAWILRLGATTARLRQLLDGARIGAA